MLLWMRVLVAKLGKSNNERSADSLDFGMILDNLQITGGPPLTQKSLTRFPVTRFLAYVRVSGGISVSRGPQYSPTNTSFM